MEKSDKAGEWGLGVGSAELFDVFYTPDDRVRVACEEARVFFMCFCKICGVYLTNVHDKLRFGLKKYACRKALKNAPP